MSIQLASNFHETAALPLDDRIVVADNTARDALASGRRYEGLVVYNQATTVSYQLKGGITNSNWVVYGAVADLVSVIANTASGAQAITSVNSLGFAIAVPIQGTDALTHQISLGAMDPDFESFMDINIIGAGGSGAISARSNIAFNKRIRLVSPVSGSTVDFGLIDEALTIPYTDLFEAEQYGFFSEFNKGTGGMLFGGGSSDDSFGTLVFGINGSTTPTMGGVGIGGAKWDGVTGINPFGDNEVFCFFQNGFGTPPVAYMVGDGSFGTNGGGQFAKNVTAPSAVLTGSNGSTETFKITSSGTGSIGVSDVFLDLRSQVLATGSGLLQNGVTIFAPTYDAAAASSINITSTWYIDAAPSAGDNMTITRSYGMLFDGSSVAAANARGIGILPQGIKTGFGNMTSLFAQSVELSPVNTDVSLGDQTANLTNLGSIYLGSIPYTSTTNVRTVTGDVGTLIIQGAPTAGANVVFSNSAKALWIQGGTTRLDGTVSIGGDPSGAVAALDIQSTTQGVLFPRMTTTQRNAITPVEGLMVYDLTLHGLFLYNGTIWVQL